MARRNARSVTESIVRYSGCPVPLGVIDFTSASKTNGTATTAFNLDSPGLAGKVLLLQSTQDCYVLPVVTSATAVTSTTGITVFANERVIITMDDYDERARDGEVRAWLAVLRVSADGNLKVWELT